MRKISKIDSIKALSYTPFRRILIGASISNVGTWVETVTVGIYMQTKTHQAFFVAAAMAVGFLPQALIGFITGSVTDRFSRKKILVIDNVLACLLALILAFAVANDFANAYFVIAVIFFAGVLNAFSFPAWQAFISDIVPKDKVPGSLTLMQAQWNLGRIIGPAIAALFVAGNHYSLALTFNSFSFVVVIGMLLLVKQKHHQPHSSIFLSKSQLLQDDISLMGGWKFVLSDASRLKKPYLAFAITVFWASPLIALFPNVADEVFKYKNLGTALFTTFQGIGAVAVTIFMTTLNMKFGPTRTQQTFLLTLPLVLIGFGLSPNLILATPIVLFFGITYNGTISSSLLCALLATPNKLKGRMTAVYMTTLGLLFPVSSILQSLFVELLGARTVFITSGFILFTILFSIGVMRDTYQLPDTYEEDTEPDIGVVQGELP